MKLLQTHEFEAVVAGGVEIAVHDADTLRIVAERLVARARVLGQVLSIEQRPLQPFAMGSHESIVSVRPAR
jgi:hypothetical protein